MVQRLLVALASFGFIGATMFTGTSPAQAAPCVSVSYSGLEFSFSTSYKITFTSSCEGTTYVNYLFTNGGSSFIRETSGFASVSRFGQSIYISLINATPGTYSPSISWTEQGTFETGRATLSQYTIRDTGSSTPDRPYSPPRPSYVPPSLPICGNGSIPTVTGKQDTESSVTFTWNAIEGTSKYRVKELRLVNGVWTPGAEWKSQNATTYTYSALAPGDSVSLYVYAECSGKIDIPSTLTVTLKAPTPVSPTFNSASSTLEWFCFSSSPSSNFTCVAEDQMSSKKKLSKAQVQAFRRTFIQDFYGDLAANSINYTGVPTVTIERPSKRITNIEGQVSVVARTSWQ